MSLVVIQDGVQSSLAIQVFESGEISCRLGDDESNLIRIDFPIPLDKSFESKYFDIFLLKSKDLKENDIFEVFIKAPEKVRAGWCIPVQALCSLEHDYAENIHFHKIAYSAAKLLIESDELHNVPLVDIDITTSISFSSFFDSNTCVFIIDRSTITTETFELNNWLPSLFVNGFTPVDSRRSRPLIEFGVMPEGHQVVISPTSTFVENRSFIDTVFLDYLPYESNVLIIFFYLYQIIELLIGQIYRDEQRELLEEVKSTQNIIKCKDIIEKFQKLMKEKTRLQKLINEYMTRPIDSSAIAQSCNDFLISIESETYGTIHESIYRARNLVFHSFGEVHAKCDRKFDQFVQDLSAYIVDVLCQFSKPTTEKLVDETELETGTAPIL